MSLNEGRQKQPNRVYYTHHSKTDHFDADGNEYRRKSIPESNRSFGCLVICCTEVLTDVFKPYLQHEDLEGHGVLGHRIA